MFSKNCQWGSLIVTIIHYGKFVKNLKDSRALAVLRSQWMGGGGGSSV
jgi:hypothetical protein